MRGKASSRPRGWCFRAQALHAGLNGGQWQAVKSFQFLQVPVSLGTPGSVRGCGGTVMLSGSLWRCIVVWGKWVRALPGNVFLAYSGRWTDILWWLGLKPKDTPLSLSACLSSWDTLEAPSTLYPQASWLHAPFSRPGRILDFWPAFALKGQSHPLLTGLDWCHFS
jgi:hypothetical protein